MLDKNINFKRKNMKLKNHLYTLNNTMEMREERVSDPEVKKRFRSLSMYTQIDIHIYRYRSISKLKKISEERLKTNE